MSDSIDPSDLRYAVTHDPDGSKTLTVFETDDAGELHAASIELSPAWARMLSEQLVAPFDSTRDPNATVLTGDELNPDSR